MRGTQDLTVALREWLHICSTSMFLDVWKPAADDLGLELIPMLPALWITEKNKEAFLSELDRLAMWGKTNASENEYLSQMLKLIERMREVVVTTDFANYEISTG